MLPLACMGTEACLGQAPQEVAFREAAEPCTNTDLKPCPPKRLPMTDTSLAAPHLSGVTPAQGPPSVSGSLIWMAVLDSRPLLMFFPQPPGQSNS